MAYYFDNATLLGYSLDRKYGSENNDFVLHTLKNISLEGILDYKSINKDAGGVKDYLADITNIISLSSGNLEPISINGYYLGSGRIKNISFDKKNPILFGNYKYDIEILEASNLSGFSGDYYGTFLYGINEKILALDENFDFNYSNNKYIYNHNLNIKLGRSYSGENLINKSKNLASGILNDTINLGLLGEYSGYYNLLKNKKHTISEKYDLIENSYNFSKSIEIDKNYSGDYGLDLKYVISNDNLGKATVQENGIINFVTPNLTNQQKNLYLNEEIKNSYGRCSGLFQEYTSKYNLGNSFNFLNSKPQIVSRKNSPFEEKLEYSTSYVNDITYFGNYFLNYEVNQKTNVINEIETIENGEIYIIANTGEIFFPNDIINSRRASYDRIKNYNIGYSLLNSTNNYENIFKYTITSTNNICYRPNDLVTYLSFSNDLDIPTNITTEFLFPKNMFKINSNKRKLGQASTKIKAVVPNGLASNANLIFGEINYISSTTSYINKAVYTYDSDGNVSAQIDQII
jgi:hypothetical protein